MRLDSNAYRNIALVSVAIGAALSCSQHRGIEAPPMRIESTDFELESGFRLLFQEEPGSGLASLSVVVGSGATKDPPGREGLAHLVEHLLFRRRLPGGRSYSSELARLGGEFNAFTSHDWTRFDSFGPSERLEDLVRIQMDALVDPLAGVTAEDLAVERQVVRSELREDAEARWTGARDAIMKEIFPPSHAYHRSVLGSAASLDAITLDDARSFVREHYRPHAMTMVVGADVSRDSIGPLLQRVSPPALARSSGAKRATTLPRAVPAVPEPAQVGQPVVAVAPVPQRTLVLAWSTPGGWRGTDAISETIAEILPAALADGLEESDAESVDCGAVAAIEGSTLACFLSLGDGADPKAVAARALNGLHFLRDRDGAYWRSLAIVEARQKYALSVFRAAAEIDRTADMATHLHFTGNAETLPRTLQDILRADAPAVTKFASKWINRERAVQVVLEPRTRADAAPVAMDSQALWSGAILQDQGPAPSTGEIASIAARTDLKEVSELTLRTGLRIVTARNRRAPFVRVSLLTSGGYLNDEPDGVVSYALRSHRAGDAWDVLGAWGSRNHPDSSVLSLEIPATALPEGLRLLRKRVESTGLAVERANWRTFAESTATKARRDTLEVRLVQILYSHLVPEHAYGRGPFPPPESPIPARKETEAWIERTLVPKNATILVVGDVGTVVAQDAAILAWGEWGAKQPGERLTVPRVEDPIPSSRRVAVLSTTGGQADIALACRISPRRRDGVTSELLAAHLQRSLTTALRDEAGATYAVSVTPFQHEFGLQALEARVRVSVADAGTALRRILDSIESIASQPPAGEDLRRTAFSLARKRRLAPRTNLAIESALVDLIRAGRPVDELALEGGWLAAISPEDIREAAAACAGHESVVVSGPGEPLMKSLAPFSPALAVP